MVDHNFMKRVAPFLVLEILKAHTDEEHGLKVTQVVELLEQDYSVTMERKAVSRVLNDLYELTEISKSYNWKNPMPYSIKYDTISRSSSEIKDNWRVCKPFDDVEVQVLMDALRTVQGYPTAGLMEKVQKLGSHAMQKGNSSTDGKPSGNSMRYNMDAIMRAIREEKKITFGYQGTEEQCVVSPYKMALRDGVYYLACFDESKNEMAVNQIEYMTNVQMLEASVKDYRMVKGASQWNYDLGYFLDIKLKQK